jgi:sialate O-acetylesterase
MKNAMIVIFFFAPLFFMGQLRLPSILSSGMVLQQHDAVNLWGWSGPGEKVYVSTSWDNQTDSTTVSNGATWKLKIHTPAAGGPYSITIRGKNSILLENVLIGEVWVCSGQSNMEMSYNWGIKSMATDVANALNNKIRFFQIPKSTAPYPQDDLKGQWVVCDSNTIKSFSAAGYYFGRQLNQQLNVPVGLINTSWGGTPAEVWTPRESIESKGVLKAAATKLQSNPWWPSEPGVIFNAMVAPITNFNIAGSIWYQGESNTINNATYEQLFTSMIDDWRKAWHKEFPFYYVQIAPYKYGNNNAGALLQEQQFKTMRHPNVGMVVTTDIIDTVTDIHPKNKKEVGQRLANWALAETYHVPGLVYKSPVFKSAEMQKGKMLLSFDNAPNGLMAKDKIVSGFYLSGADENWVRADAKLEKGKITIWNKQLKEPMYIRYGFGNTIIGNVFSAEGLPVVPFRSDNFVVDQSPVK